MNKPSKLNILRLIMAEDKRSAELEAKEEGTTDYAKAVNRIRGGVGDKMDSIRTQLLPGVQPPPQPTEFERTLDYLSGRGIITPAQRDTSLMRQAKVLPGPVQPKQPENQLDIEYKQTRNQINKLTLEEKKTGKTVTFDEENKKLLDELKKLKSPELSGVLDVTQRTKDISSRLQYNNAMKNIGFKHNGEVIDLQNAMKLYKSDEEFLKNTGILRKFAQKALDEVNSVKQYLDQGE